MLGSSIFLARLAKQGSGGKGGEPLLTTCALCCVIALTVRAARRRPWSSATTLDAAAWRGSALTVRWPADGCRRRRGRSAANGDADRRQPAGGGRRGRGTAGARARPAGGERADESCAATELRPSISPSGLGRTGRRPDLSSRRIADKTNGRHRPLLMARMRGRSVRARGRSPTHRPHASRRLSASGALEG